MLVNLVSLGPDIVLAHAIDSFAVPSQWIPVAFSAVAPPLYGLSWWLGRRSGERGLGRILALAIGWVAVGVGIAGLLLHLEGTFFRERTLRNLVYTAPFAAPLAYTGLGLLILLERMRVRDEREWVQWVLVLALGGFVGNFALSLADHAQNGFFVWQEWLAVASSALAIGFLASALLFPMSRSALRACAAVMGLQVVVGVAGLALHNAANWAGPAESMLDNFLYGAPAFAPMLFADLALLGWIGLWAQYRCGQTSPAA